MQNLHTHTVFSDGKNTPEEMAISAIELGMSSLGFSDHAPMTVTTSWGMPEEKIPDYLDEINRIKKEMSGRLEIYAGMELDSTSPPLPYPFDYTIGSVHYYSSDGRFYPVDLSRESFLSTVQVAFHGNIYAALSNYFQRVVEFAYDNPYQIQGHFDLPVIWCGKDPVFDTADPSYRQMAIHALHEVAEAGKIIEINTGAMSRGYTDYAYPQLFLLQECQKYHIPVLLSSDSHRTDSIIYAFDKMRKLLLELGFKTQRVLTSRGWDEIPL